MIDTYSIYHPEKEFDMDLMCPFVIRKTKTKIKTMSRDLSYYATFDVCVLNLLS